VATIDLLLNKKKEEYDVYKLVSFEWISRSSLWGWVEMFM